MTDTAGRLDGLEDDMARLRAELESVKDRYAADPKNWKLAEEFGWASQRLIHAKRAGKPRIPAVRPEPERTLSKDEYLALLPERCPECEGYVRDEYTTEEVNYPLRGFFLRIAETGVRCTLCRHTWEI
jgi:hypothetical protein